jgi:hypothetical protein
VERDRAPQPNEFPPRHGWVAASRGYPHSDHSKMAGGLVSGPGRADKSEIS